MSAYTIEIEEVKTENAFEGTGFGPDRGLCVAWSVIFVTHPCLFRGRVNRKLSINLLGRRRDGRFGHFFLRCYNAPFARFWLGYRVQGPCFRGVGKQVIH